jgi:hypothetical protein
MAQRYRENRCAARLQGKIPPVDPSATEKSETRDRRENEKKNATGKTQPLPGGGVAVSERSRSTHGAPAGESCRKKNKRRRRAVDRTLTHEEDASGGAIRDEKTGAAKNAAQKGARHSAVAARFGGDKTHNPSARRVRRAGPQYA